VTDRQRRVSGDLLIVTASVKGYKRPFKVLIDCGATRNYGCKQSIAENTPLFAQACERVQGMASVRLAAGVVARTKKVEVDLRVAFNDFDSVGSFTVLDMDGRFDLILGMPWLERHEPWIDWRSKSIGSSSPGRSEDQARHEPSFAHQQVNSITSDGTEMHFVGVVNTTEGSEDAPLTPSVELAPLVASMSHALNVVDTLTGVSVDASTMGLAPLPGFAELTSLEELSMDDFAHELRASEIAEVVILRS
jgi:hypothetical protein